MEASADLQDRSKWAICCDHPVCDAACQQVWACQREPPPPPQVHSVAPDASGQWLASGSADGTMRLWEVATARCVRVWELGAAVSCVAWCPNPALHILSAVSGTTAVLLWSGVAPTQVKAQDGRFCNGYD